MTNNYFNNNQSGFRNPYIQNNMHYGNSSQPFQRSPYSFGAPQTNNYDTSFRNFNRMQQNLYNPQYYNNQQPYMNAFQQAPRRQKPPIDETFNMLASHMGTINNGVNMIRQMGSLLGLLR